MKSAHMHCAFAKDATVLINRFAKMSFQSVATHAYTTPKVYVLLGNIVLFL